MSEHHKKDRKSRRAWRRRLSTAMIVIGLAAFTIPLIVSACSIYYRQSSAARWKEQISRAAGARRTTVPKTVRSKITASGDGFAPGSEVVVFFDGARTATGRASETGHAAIEVLVPTGTLRGIHSVVMRGTGPDGSPVELTSNVSIGSAELPAKAIRLTPGDEIAFMTIEKIGVKTGVREEASWGNLVKGPARVSETTPIGQPGTALISGHRTMYGAPFSDLDKLKPKDSIKLYTKDHLYVYEVVKSAVVKPTDMGEIEPYGDPRLVLSTCEPRYYSTSRLLIIAKLKEAFTY